MRKVVASEIVSLDGVVESPDKWHFPYFNDQMADAIGAAMAASDAMLMGRVLYEEWAAFWPNQDPNENPVAAQMNGVRKYVVSGLDDPRGAPRVAELHPVRGQRCRGDLQAQGAAGQGHLDIRQPYLGPVTAARRPPRRT